MCNHTEVHWSWNYNIANTHSSVSRSSCDKCKTLSILETSRPWERSHNTVVSGILNLRLVSGNKLNGSFLKDYIVLQLGFSQTNKIPQATNRFYVLFQNGELPFSSGNPISHWSINWGQFNVSICSLVLPGSVATSCPLYKRLQVRIIYFTKNLN